MTDLKKIQHLNGRSHSEQQRWAKKVENDTENTAIESAHELCQWRMAVAASRVSRFGRLVLVINSRLHCSG